MEKFDTSFYLQVTSNLNLLDDEEYTYDENADYETQIEKPSVEAISEDLKVNMYKSP